MNRIWFAFIFIAAAIMLCTYEQHTVKTTFENIDTMLSTVETAAKQEDYDTVDKKCRQLENFWTEKYPHLAAMIHHSQLEELNTSLLSIRTLAKERNDDLASAIDRVESQAETIYDESKVTLGNIF